MLKKLIRPSGFKLGLIITFLLCWLKLTMDFSRTFAVSHIGRLFNNIENTWADMKFRIHAVGDREEFQKNAHVVIVAIDEKSIRMEDLGMFPWPRAKIARMVEQLRDCGARVIGFDVIFAEPDSSRAEPVVAEIIEKYSGAAVKDPVFSEDLARIHDGVQGDKKFAQVLEDAENVVLGYFFFQTPQEIAHLEEQDIKEGMDRIGFGTISYLVKYKGTDLSTVFPRALGVRANLPVLTEAAELYGYFNVLPDLDGIYRRVPMVFAFKKEQPEGEPAEGARPRVEVFPSLSAQMLSAYYGQPLELFVDTFTGKEYVEGYVGLFIGPIGMPTEEHIEIPVEKSPGGLGGLFRVNYYGPQQTFKHISAGDIIHGDQQACQAVKDKVVLVGATAMTVYDLRPTPFEANFPGVEIHASIIENIITKDFLLRPIDFPVWEAVLMLLVGIILSWLLNRLRFTIGVLITVGYLLALLGVDVFLLFSNGMMANVILQLIHSVILLMGIAVYRYVTEERQKREIRHAFQFYLSGSVIDTMLHDTSKLKLGGERRELTVLFSDIRGFTTISEQLAPEAVTELLNEYLTPMTDLVFRYNGTLDKYMGDAIMAFFGAPVAFDDHPRAACRTALEMMEKLKELQAGWRERGVPELDIGIGINTGPMSVGNMGSADRFDYTVLGDHVNLGSRLEGLNKQYGTHVIISEFTQARLEDHFTCRELDAVQVKGKQEPVRIFELLHWGPPGEADAWIQDFHQALGEYKQREWDKAVAGFEKLTDDMVSKMYIKRCQEMQANPPGPEWDGVYKMTTK